MKLQGKLEIPSSIALDNNNTVTASPEFSTQGNLSVVPVYPISDRIRPEPPFVISHLHVGEIETWMILGDNEILVTALEFLRSYLGSFPSTEGRIVLEYGVPFHIYQHRFIGRKNPVSSPYLDGT